MFTKLLKDPKRSVVREVCWIISNLCVGTKTQLDQIFNNPLLLTTIAELYQTGESVVKKEVSYILGNICNSGQHQRVLELVSHYALLESLAHFIAQEEDGQCLEGGLFALFELLKIGDKVGGRNVVYLKL